ncbi:isoamylase early set domain-containing protein [Desulfovibrio inopinatus]|uniref:isoamylase early set domain-containing protein n=1 Tax=Desulfovibrio inopinatus TaxID=102109 RepID=UPI0004186D8E|nr:isoamylase early set domain-containing protein [Desulfovibrio inopinatus]
MTIHDSLPSEDRETAERIANMRYAPAPENLVAGVMHRIQATQATPSRWQRLKTWLLTPRPIRIAPWIPLTASGFALAILLVVGLIPSKPIGNAPVSIAAHETGLAHVVFTLHANNAEQVSLIGSFNNWQAGTYNLKPTKTPGIWTISIPLSQGRHEYAFVLDTTRIVPDPKALVYEDDGFGNLNSVIIVGNHEQSL